MIQDPTIEVMIRYIAARDRSVMQRLNRWRAPLWIQRWMLLASRAGDGWLWCTVGLVIFFFGGTRGPEALKAGFVATGAGQITFFVLKRLFGRERPCVTETHCWATLIPPDRFSFPSGHSITAFAIALALGYFYPELLAGLIFCAASVAASRVILGLHYLSDVVAGTAIGSIIGLVSAILISG